MKIIVIYVLFTVLSQSIYGQAKEQSPSGPNQLKPRVMILTDVSSWETDDSESLVRLLVHADMVEIEGLIYTTGWSLEETRDDFFRLIHDAVDAYEKDLPNLMKRSNQKAFKGDESEQSIGYWPSPEYLRKRTMFGSKKRGMSVIGEDNISPGSTHIIEQADLNDDRPLWVLFWGGGNTLAQAIWTVQQERDEEELKTFLHKIPTYAITDQDRSYKEGTPFDISSHQWMREEFKEDLLFIWDECAWKYQNGTGKENWEEYATHIQTHGNLGKVYPKYKFGVEGDTPSFLHILPNGLNDPTQPTQVGWGGYFEWGMGPDEKTYAYTNHKGTPEETCKKYMDHFYSATFNNFVARMDWANEGKGNRNPIISINDDQSIDIIKISGSKGKEITLNASQTIDLDGDQLQYKWWVIPEAGNFDGKVFIDGANQSVAKVKIPKQGSGDTIHIICEVIDDGSPKLSSYRRVIVDVKSK